MNVVHYMLFFMVLSFMMFHLYDALLLYFMDVVKDIPAKPDKKEPERPYSIDTAFIERGPIEVTFNFEDYLVYKDGEWKFEHRSEQAVYEYVCRPVIGTKDVMWKRVIKK